MDSERNQKCIQALDIILRHGPAYQYTVVIYFILFIIKIIK